MVGDATGGRVTANGKANHRDTEAQRTAKGGNGDCREGVPRKPSRWQAGDRLSLRAKYQALSSKMERFSQSSPRLGASTEQPSPSASDTKWRPKSSDELAAKMEQDLLQGR